jgi:hypothetical protein
VGAFLSTASAPADLRPARRASAGTTGAPLQAGGGAAGGGGGGGGVGEGVVGGALGRAALGRLERGEHLAPPPPETLGRRHGARPPPMGTRPPSPLPHS